MNEKIRKYRMLRTLQGRFLVSYLIVLSIVITILAVFFYRYTTAILIERESSSMQDLTESVFNQIDNHLTSMDNICLSINYANGMKNSIIGNTLGEQNSRLSSLAELFVAINSPDFFCQQLFLYDFDGNYVGSGLTSSTGVSDIQNTHWYQWLKENHRSFYVSPPYNKKFTNSTDKYFISLYRMYHNRNGEPEGIVETITSCRKLFSYIDSYTRKNTDGASIYVYNEDGNLIYPYSQSSLEDNACKYWDFISSTAFSSEICSQFHKVGTQNFMFSSVTSPYSRWTYVTARPQAQVLMPVALFQKLLISVLLLTVAISFIISWIMSRQLSKPIRGLKNTISGTALKNLGISYPSQTISTGLDEFDELNQAFSQMGTSLKKSMDEMIVLKQQEVKSRLLALQSQMNPHFYYNSLSCIMILVKSGKTNQTLNFCENLSAIMRYISTTDTSSVTLGDEIDYVRQYLSCMKVRYQNILEYHIEVDPSILSFPVPRLILQPLAENSLKYGIDSEPPWKITIIGEMYTDYWRIDICDSGSGFSDETISNLHEKIHLIDKNASLPQLEVNGMGLINVYSRWKLFGGENAFLTFGNLPGRGAVVSLGMKLNEQEEK